MGAIRPCQCAVLAGGGDRGRGGPLRVPSGQALRQAQGERIWEARVRWGVGVRWGGDAPRLAPLDSCLRRNDACCGGLVVGLRQAQGERIWEARLAVGSGGCDGDWRAPRLAPLDSCLRRNDARGGVREGREVGTSPRRPCPGFPRERERRWGVWWDALARGVRVRVGARSRGRAVREPPLRGEGEGVMRGLSGGGDPLRVPSGQASTGSGRTDSGSGPTRYVGVRGFATVARFGVVLAFDL